MNEENSKTLFSGKLDIFYSQFYIESIDADDNVDLSKDFFGHNNGLCGAGIKERIMFTATNNSVVSLEVILYQSAPILGTEFSEVVEVPFNRGKNEVYLCEWAHEEVHLLNFPEGEYRVRYSIVGFDKDYDPDIEDEEYFEKPIPGQIYLIQIWPEKYRPDEIIKQTSEQAAYWHKLNGNV